MAQDAATPRDRMVRDHLAARGVRDSAVLRAMREVPREDFVAPEMVEFAYEDHPLPIGEGQTISQPYIVAAMAEALELGPDDRILDVGTGSGYAAAVLSRIGAEVFTVERHRSLAEVAERRFEELGYDNIEVHVGDGTLGWEDRAPFDAIVVAAGGPRVPPELKEQLAPGGRLIIPVGETPRVQKLLRVRREADGSFREEDLGDVRFVPLIGASGWSGEEDGEGQAGGRGPDEAARRWGGREGGRTTYQAGAEREAPPRRSLPDLVRASSEAIESIEGASMDRLLDRIGDARVVLLGEATHGTSEFYRMRARITRELIERKGFRIVAVEADWPDASRVDAYVRHHDVEPFHGRPFSRFPTWMWANEEVAEFAHWLRDRNEGLDPEDRAGFFGLDLYSLHASIEAVLRYLDDQDPQAAETARARYGCLTPWEGDAATYGRAVLTGRYRACEEEVVGALKDLMQNRLAYVERDGRRYMDAVQNARLVANAERYYRVMYYGSRDSWNLRDQHMFDTLRELLDFHGPDSRAVVWEHNSHVGDASATEMGARGEHNVGQLARRQWRDGAYIVGFGTHTGTVAAAHDWGSPMEVMDVRPSHPDSYERICHDAEMDAFLLPLREPDDPEVRRRLLEERLERAIGVIYRPRTELASHYFRAALPRQFDEYCWFDETRAVTPLRFDTGAEEGDPETFPFAL